MVSGQPGVDYEPPEYWKDRWCWGENHTECCNNITTSSADGCSKSQYNTAGCIYSEIVTTCGKGCDPSYGCEAAGLGYYIPDGSRYRWKCQSGTYCPTNHERWYTKCSTGTYQPEAGGASCLPCPIGTYQPFEGKPHCNECPEFSYQDEEGQSECKPCIPGYIGFGAQAAGYDSNTGQMICLENEDYLPSSRPSSIPSVMLSNIPSNIPSLSPSNQPSYSMIPSSTPSQQPSTPSPSGKPSTIPSAMPSIQPTQTPTQYHSEVPSTKPTNIPTIMPSSMPSTKHTSISTQSPSIYVSESPSSNPTATQEDNYNISSEVFVVTKNECGLGYTGEQCNLCCDSFSSLSGNETTKTISSSCLPSSHFNEAQSSISSDEWLQLKRYFRLNHDECLQCQYTKEFALIVILGFIFGVLLVVHIIHELASCNRQQLFTQFSSKKILAKSTKKHNFPTLILMSMRPSVGLIFVALEYIQILSLFLVISDKIWPHYMKKALTYLSILRLENIFTGMECLISFSENTFPPYILHWAVIITFPILLLMLLKLICRAIPSSSMRRSIRNKSMGIFYISLYIIHLKLITLSAEVFYCTEPKMDVQDLFGDDQGSYMVKTHWKCYDTKDNDSYHTKLLPFAIFSFILYGIGVPFFLLHRFSKSSPNERIDTNNHNHSSVLEQQNDTVRQRMRKDQIRKAHDYNMTFHCPVFSTNQSHSYYLEAAGASSFASDDSIRQKYGLFYTLYKPEFWYWGILIFIRKLVLILLIICFRKESILQLCTIVIFLAFWAFVEFLCQPYLCISNCVYHGVKKQRRSIMSSLTSKSTLNNTSTMSNGASIIEDKTVNPSPRIYSPRQERDQQQDTQHNAGNEIIMQMRRSTYTSLQQRIRLFSKPSLENHHRTTILTSKYKIYGYCWNHNNVEIILLTVLIVICVIGIVLNNSDGYEELSNRRNLSASTSHNLDIFGFTLIISSILFVSFTICTEILYIFSSLHQRKLCQREIDQNQSDVTEQQHPQQERTSKLKLTSVNVNENDNVTTGSNIVQHSEHDQKDYQSTIATTATRLEETLVESSFNLGKSNNLETPLNDYNISSRSSSSSSSLFSLNLSQHESVSSSNDSTSDDDCGSVSSIQSCGNHLSQLLLVAKQQPTQNHGEDDENNIAQRGSKVKDHSTNNDNEQIPKRRNRLASRRITFGSKTSIGNINIHQNNDNHNTNASTISIGSWFRRISQTFSSVSIDSTSIARRTSQKEEGDTVYSEAHHQQAESRTNNRRKTNNKRQRKKNKSPIREGNSPSSQLPLPPPPYSQNYRQSSSPAFVFRKKKEYLSKERQDSPYYSPRPKSEPINTTQPRYNIINNRNSPKNNNNNQTPRDTNETPRGFAPWVPSGWGHV